MFSDNNKLHDSVGIVVLLYYRIIVLFAGERMFKIGTLLEKLQAKWLIASHALFAVHCPA